MVKVVFDVLRGCQGCALAIGLLSQPAYAQTPETSYNSYGFPGMIDMPVATSRPDGELGFTISHFRNTTRNTLTFQITPRLSGSFRYSMLYDIRPGGPSSKLYDYVFDRSFSLHYRLADETRRRPAIAIGLNDFLGTGIYSSEYIVATKSVGSRLRYSVGLGWGRLAGVGRFRNPLSIFSSHFDTRPDLVTDEGGQVRQAQWFRGDAALFGGIEYQATDRLKLIAEYSSDAYTPESPSAFHRRNPFNFSLEYALRPNIHLSARYLYGAEFGLQLSMALNPKRPKFSSGRERAPLAVVPRNPRSAKQLGWPDTIKAQAGPGAGSEARLRKALAGQGLRLVALQQSGATVRVEIENKTYPQTAQAIGRTARALTGAMPPGVETFVIFPVAGGIAASEVKLRRSDLEALEFDLDNAWASYARAEITPVRTRLTPLAEAYPKFDVKLGPYFAPSLFDPDNPLRADAGIELRFSYEPAQGLEIGGGLRKKLLGNRDTSTRASNSVLPHVRSDFNLYEKNGDPALTDLTAAYYFTPARDVYGRVTLGYLEPMFGGLSTELLWKPSGSRFGLGVEANYVRQRDFDQRFGFRDYEVMTGHVSGYWAMRKGYHAQLDVGRYLAGDWGATLSMDREFANGWKVGAFATLTNVSASDFGEGSFDKGIRITIPTRWISGDATKDRFSTTLRPVTRDGGARLDVRGRLYERVRGLQERELQAGWGRFWR